MYTRCPECESTHVLNAASLAHSRGSVRCGHCGRKFDALETLFDEWPAVGATPPPAGARYRPPVLGNRQDLVVPFGPATVHYGSTRPGKAWLLLAFVLTAVTLANLAWMYRTELTAQPEIRAALRDFGLEREALEPPFRDPTQLQVISRDLHSHPTRAGLLVLSATFVNRAERAQAWPELELTLLDPAGRTVAARRFSVDEYLPGKGEPPPLLGPEVHVPVLLEFVNPGELATGFTIAFH